MAVTPPPVPPQNQKPPDVAAPTPAAKPAAAITPEMMQAIAMGFAMAQQSAAQPALLGNGRLAPAPKESCMECKQDVRACKGEHIDMVVYPVNERWAVSFQGVRLNGVNYRSNHAGHFLKVPKANDIAGVIAAFEANEEVQANGRKASHNSGSLQNFQPAAQGAWR